MSRTIEAIEGHMTRRSVIQPIPNHDRRLVAEWQRGVEILGHAQRKLRLGFAPLQSPALATVGH